MIKFITIMVRLYYHPRWSKKTIGQRVLEKSLDLFEGPTTFAQSKVIHSMACYANKEG